MQAPREKPLERLQKLKRARLTESLLWVKS
jgi:hypothetical protein